MPDPRPSPTPGQQVDALRFELIIHDWLCGCGRGRACEKRDDCREAAEQIAASSPLSTGGLSEEALEAAERATSTAEKLIDAIERISGHLNDEGLADKGKINKARLVIAGLDQ